MCSLPLFQILANVGGMTQPVRIQRFVQHPQISEYKLSADPSVISELMHLFQLVLALPPGPYSQDLAISTVGHCMRSEKHLLLSAADQRVAARHTRRLVFDCLALAGTTVACPGLIMAIPGLLIDDVGLFDRRIITNAPDLIYAAMQAILCVPTEHASKETLAKTTTALHAVLSAPSSTTDLINSALKGARSLAPLIDRTGRSQLVADVVYVLSSHALRSDSRIRASCGRTLSALLRAGPISDTLCDQ
jgi:hypothetical protein